MTSITAVSVGLASSSSLEKPGHEVGRELYRADFAQPAAQVAHQVGAVQAQRQHAQQQPTKLQAKQILLLEPMLRIHDILERIRIRASADPCLWQMDPDLDPDPAMFVIDLQDAN